jgi:hypothetical protein
VRFSELAFIPTIAQLTNLGNIFPQAIPPREETFTVPEETTLEETQVEQLRQLGVFARYLSADEIVRLLQGDTTLISDLPRPGAGIQNQVATPRVLSEIVPQALALYNEIYWESVVDPDTGERTARPRNDYLRQVLTDAFTRYAQTGGDLDPVKIRAFIANDPMSAEANDLLNKLDRLIHLLKVMGLTPKEQSIAVGVLLDRNGITPEGLPWQTLQAIIEAEPPVVPTETEPVEEAAPQVTPEESNG